MISLPGLRSPDLVQGRLGMASGLVSFDRVVPAALGIALVAGWRDRTLADAASRGLTPRPDMGMRRRVDGAHGYTATAFSKPLMMIFRAVYRPTRQVEALADVSPYFPQEVRYRSEIEPTFERYVYGPIAARRAAGRRRDEACCRPAASMPISPTSSRWS